MCVVIDGALPLLCRNTDHPSDSSSSKQSFVEMNRTVRNTTDFSHQTDGLTNVSVYQSLLERSVLFCWCRPV